MLVTIFSDASICTKTGCAGWASWAKCDRGTARGDGPLKRLTLDSAVAEAMAVVNGMAVAWRERLIEPGDVLLAQTDNDAVMSVLTGTARRMVSARARERRTVSHRQLKREAKRRNIEIAEISAIYSRYLERMQVSLIWRHCKGHRGLEDKRAAVNNYCDQRARERMREARRRMATGANTVGRSSGPGTPA